MSTTFLGFKILRFFYINLNRGKLFSSSQVLTGAYFVNTLLCAALSSDFLSEEEEEEDEEDFSSFCLGFSSSSGSANLMEAMVDN
jgi:hypothetical protein